MARGWSRFRYIDDDLDIISGSEDELDPNKIACVTYSLGEIGKLSTFVKIGESVSLDTKGTEDWEVSEILVNGTPFDFEGDVLTVQITEDTDIRFVYQYAHKISYDFTSGTTTPSDSPYNISNDDEKILIRGLNGHESISIYTVNGMLMINIPVIPEDTDMAAFTLESGVYIILINDISFKIKC